MAPVKYQTIAGRDDDSNKQATESSFPQPSSSSSSQPEPSPPAMEVVILDFTHTRFTVPVAAGLTATVADLKAAGAGHHAVAANQQRLIYQGKLLSDENATMQQCGIRHGSIVHLFPKPRVVVVASNNNNNNGSGASQSQQQQQQQSNDENGGTSGSGSEQPNTATTTGRVPTIVVDENEHARRSQILVLGSVDYMEAVNNVKLFSFMLLIISTIELLNITAVALGEGVVNGDPSSSGGGMHNNEAHIPYMEHDDFFPSDDDVTGISPDNSDSSLGSGFGNNTSTGNETTNTGFVNPYQTWTPLSWIDLVVSVMGIYVALLGIRASNDNVLSIARLYMVGTAITAVGWLVYNFILNFQIDEMEREREQSQQSDSGSNLDPRLPPSPISPLNAGGANGDSVFNEAVQAMVLPAVVWGLCIFRAWQFQHLLAEAELEALERIQSEQEGDESDDEEQAQQQHHRQLGSTQPAPVALPAIS